MKRLVYASSLPGYVGMSGYVPRHTIAEYAVLCTVDNYMYISLNHLYSSGTNSILVTSLQLVYTIVGMYTQIH